MWVDMEKRLPSKSGKYLVQNIYGEVMSLNYTVPGGWNTYWDIDGTLRTEHKIDTMFHVRWFDHPEPPPVLNEWKEYYREHGNVSWEDYANSKYGDYKFELGIRKIPTETFDKERSLDEIGFAEEESDESEGLYGDLLN